MDNNFLRLKLRVTLLKTYGPIIEKNAGDQNRTGVSNLRIPQSHHTTFRDKTLQAYKMRFLRMTSE